MPSLWPIVVCGLSGIRIAAQYQVTRAESNRRVIKKSHVETAAMHSLQVKGAFHSNFCFCVSTASLSTANNAVGSPSPAAPG